MAFNPITLIPCGHCREGGHITNFIIIDMSLQSCNWNTSSSQPHSMSFIWIWHILLYCCTYKIKFSITQFSWPDLAEILGVNLMALLKISFQTYHARNMCRPLESSTHSLCFWCERTGLSIDIPLIGSNLCLHSSIKFHHFRLHWFSINWCSSK